MTEQSMRILSRFDINENPGKLEGRAYLTSYNFEKTYGSNLVYAVKKLREIVSGPELSKAREQEYKNTLAIMWGEEKEGRYEVRIDFLLWDQKAWFENGLIKTLPLRNGLIMTQNEDGSLPVTCEYGLHILTEEKNYRKRTPENIYRKFAPLIPAIGLNEAYDFSRPDGRIALKELLKLETYPILDKK